MANASERSSQPAVQGASNVPPESQRITELTQQFCRKFKTTVEWDDRVEEADIGRRHSVKLKKPADCFEWSDGFATKKEAKISALEHALRSRQELDDTTSTQGSDDATISSPSEPESETSTQNSTSQRNFAGNSNNSSPRDGVVGFDVVYGIEAEVSPGTCIQNEAEELVRAFELAPGAHDMLKVQSIYKPPPDSDMVKIRQNEFSDCCKKLQSRADDSDYPKPSWLRHEDGDNKTDEELAEYACARREREEVLWHLESASERKSSKVRSVRVFHGCPSLQVAQSIFKNGFAANVCKTKGWFGEGVYSSLSAPYALRYSFDMRDHWEKMGESGYVIAAQAVFAQVYPITQADNDEPLKPKFKGARIGFPDGAQGCDAHFVCVRGFPPNENHVNRTYHACAAGQRPDGTELVVSQEVQLLPEYIIHVKVGSDPLICKHVHLAAERWGRSEAMATSSGSTSTEPEIGVGGKWKSKLNEVLQRTWKKKLSDAEIKYETNEGSSGQFQSTVTLSFPGQEAQTFIGVPDQPRKIAAEQSAAKNALDALQGQI
eukprot:gnl/MRDRNA2_/MRDRNA2_93081_c0_seq1.p1 gnl/MRDRNA2_/MRDRNA2_93081_c0~~gnl/MRDRNA2_/MRDRNA2_93081_c0_seq1.p1  ORF type:complete len:547 (+),score=101.60 gnl/MRDRNA2_/MRDRNA2_93081_c0_seq1:79-1719(+)